jgi:hypothetical protein
MYAYPLYQLYDSPSAPCSISVLLPQEIVPTPSRADPKPATRRREPPLTQRGFAATQRVPPNPADHTKAVPAFTAAGAALRDAVREARGELTRPASAYPLRSSALLNSSSGGTVREARGEIAQRTTMVHPPAESASGDRDSPARAAPRGDVEWGGDALLRSRVLPDLDVGGDAGGDILERWRASRKAARPRPRGMPETVRGLGFFQI